MGISVSPDDWVQWRTEDGGNGHWYAAIIVPLTWTGAKTAAEALGGHLATITSAAENAFVFGATGSGRNFYLGGFQPPGSPEPAGNWQWVTGEPFSYTNWGSGEPNNVGRENALHFTNSFAQWNDISATAFFGYIVELEQSPLPQFLAGTDGDDTLSGGINNDTILGLAGGDSLSGEAGNDVIQGDNAMPPVDGEEPTGNDTISGGDGDDTIGGDRGDDLIMGDAGNDELRGGLGNDTVDGGAGNDSVFGGSGTDSLLGGAGNDTIDGGAGDDSVEGGDGKDSLEGRNGSDDLDGGDGNDRLSGGNDNDTVAGGLGNDRAFGDGGDDQMSGGDGNDTLSGSAGNDTVCGDGGEDRLIGNSGDDSLCGGEGNDTLEGVAGNDTLTGDAGNDSLDGGAGGDSLEGGDGADRFVFAAAQATDGVIDHDVVADYDASEGDVISLGLGVEIIASTISAGGNLLVTLTGDDTVEFVGLTDIDQLPVGIFGTDGNDSLVGTDSGDAILGLGGSDTIDGLGGGDTIHGGDGGDEMTGGAGADTFVFAPDAAPSADVDWVQWETSAGGNGHWYAAISRPLTWTGAKTAAEAQGGHLATITSAAENAFVFGLVEATGGGFYYALGGFQPPGSPEPAGNWQWVTGEPFSYTNWVSGEPNNIGGENALMFVNSLAQWNDIPATALLYYTVETTALPGRDTVTDFTPGEDIVDLRAFGIADADALGDLLASQGGNTIIQLSEIGGRDVQLAGVNILDLSTSDFLI